MKEKGEDYQFLKRIFSKKNKGQVWIETVIYTLIAFVIIGLVLAYANPKIKEIQDTTVLQQSTDLLKQIDSTISTMGAAGNQRLIEVGIKEGELDIDGKGNGLIFKMNSQSLYSEPGKIVYDGNVMVNTTKESGYNLVTLTMNYSGTYDIRFNGEKIVKVLSQASTPYKLSITNEGENANSETILNMSLD
jgi:type II secretory pathway pseudopilin PulG